MVTRRIAAEARVREPTNQNTTKIRLDCAILKVYLQKHIPLSQTTNKQHVVYSWYIDSGASFHMCCDLSSFSSYEKIPDWPVTIANGEKIYAKGR